MTPTYILTTIVTPPTGGDLTTLATWKDDWGVTGTDNDGFLARTITRCSASAAQFCNRRFGIATYSDEIQLAHGVSVLNGRQSPLMLSQYPLISVASITETDANGTATVLVEGVDFKVDYTNSKLYRLNSSQQPRDWWPMMRVTVVYQAGYVLPGVQGRTLPDDIEDAVGRMVYTRWSERRRDSLIKAETVEGVGRTEFIVTTATDGGNMSPDVSDILLNYRTPVVA